MGRRLGQHFLTDPGVLDRIVDALEPQPAELVIEIGPGRGTLTRRLAPRVKTVIAIEKDPELAAAAIGKPAAGFPDNARVICGDALTLDWHGLAAEAGYPGARFKVVGNIPYYITSPLIEKALTPPAPRVIVYLVQREVADRLAALPGSKIYGALSVGVQVAAEIERLFVVRGGAFDPPPKVDSAVVRLRPRVRPWVDRRQHGSFRQFVTAIFGQRRKQMGRVLRGVAALQRDPAERLLQELGIDPASRPEVLEPQTFVRLFQALRR